MVSGLYIGPMDGQGAGSPASLPAGRAAVSADRINRAASETGDALLFTPGPLTTSRAVKQAMVHDWGSRDAEFLRINRYVLDSITALAGGTTTHVTVPVQGSGT